MLLSAPVAGYPFTRLSHCAAWMASGGDGSADDAKCEGECVQGRFGSLYVTHPRSRVLLDKVYLFVVERRTSPRAFN